MSFFDPLSGNNNIMTEVVEKRLYDRNPFIKSVCRMTIDGNGTDLFQSIEAFLRLVGDCHLNSMQAINLAYSFCMKEYEKDDRLLGLLYGCLSLPVKNNEGWEKIVCMLLDRINEKSIKLEGDLCDMLKSRVDYACTEKFLRKVGGIEYK